MLPVTDVNSQASNADFEFAALSNARNYRAALIREFSPHLIGNVAEIGAGVGQFSRELIALRDVKHLLAVEPDPRFFGRLREQIGSERSVQGVASQVNSSIPWNAVVSVNVLEHIDNDERELATYHSLLQPTGGTLCLFVPARPEIFAAIDQDFGHFRRYRKAALRDLLVRAGFEVQKCKYFNFLGYFAWWTTFKLLKRRAFNARAVTFYDRVLFPSMYWAESHICAPPLGQSLVAIAHARKR